MFFYNIGYSYEEGSNKFVLIHENRYSQDEFESLIAEVVSDILLNKREEYLFCYAETEEGELIDEFCEEDEFMECDISPTFDRYFTYFSEILDGIVFELCSKFGFKQLEFEVDIIEGRCPLVDKRVYDNSSSLIKKICDKYWKDKEEK